MTIAQLHWDVLEAEICRMDTSNMWVRLRLRNFFCSQDWKKQRQRRITPLDFQTRKLVVSRMLLDAIIPALPTESCWARKSSPWRTEISAKSSGGGNRLQNWIRSTKPRVRTHTGKVTELLLEKWWYYGVQYGFINCRAKVISLQGWCPC